jgi:sulfide:quinone oxidoreductase
MNDFRVVICGGGIAAIEGLLRLRRLAGDGVHVDLVAPNEELVYRPLAVRQPFAFGPPSRYSLKRIAADAGADWLQDSLDWVDRDAQVIHTTGGESMHFDALLVATGARQIADFEHVGTFSDAAADETYQGVVQDIEGGYSKSVAFLLPQGPAYPLPIYELALMTAERAQGMGIDGLELSVVTPEPSPLAIFGATASEAVSRLLDEAGVAVYCSAFAQVPAAGQLLIQPHGVELNPGRMIAMPRVEGPGIRGLAGGGAHGFVPIDSTCRVPGNDGRVYAAGDAAAYPIKQGGLGAQMADTAAAGIARLAGVDTEVTPFRPVIRGKVLGGKEPLYISARLVGAKGFQSEVHEKPPWPEDEKVVAEELGPYLAQFDGSSGAPAPAG